MASLNGGLLDEEVSRGVGDHAPRHSQRQRECRSFDVSDAKAVHDRAGEVGKEIGEHLTRGRAIPQARHSRETCPAQSPPTIRTRARGEVA